MKPYCKSAYYLILFIRTVTSICTVEYKTNHTQNFERNSLGLNCDDVYSLPLSVHYTEFVTLCISNSWIARIPKNAFDKFSKLATLTINHVRIETLEPGSFLGLVNLKELHLAQNILKEIKSNTFIPLTALEVLDLSDNRIENLAVNEIQKLTSLKKIFLKGNNLRSIDFSNATSLQYIDVSVNKIDEINESTFQNLNRLTRLYIGSNRIRILPLGVFKDLSQLDTLDLSNNSLIFISPGSLSGLTNLTNLNLSNNHLTTIDGTSFHLLINLKHLNINNNLIGNVDLNTFSFFPTGLEEVYLDGNKFTCSRLTQTIELFGELNIDVSSGKSFHIRNVNGIACDPRNNSEIVETSSHAEDAEDNKFREAMYLDQLTSKNISDYSNVATGNISVDIPDAVDNIFVNTIKSLEDTKQQLVGTLQRTNKFLETIEKIVKDHKDESKANLANILDNLAVLSRKISDIETKLNFHSKNNFLEGRNHNDDVDT